MTFLALLVPELPQPAESVWHAIVRDWHNDVILAIRDRLPKVAIILLLLFAVQRAISFFAGRMARVASRPEVNPHRAAQIRTMAAIVRATSFGVFGFLGFLQVLNLLNINVEPILASAGILGVGVGLGAQSLFKDLINGVFILIEDQYNVGDTVKIASLTGTVEDLNFRLTRLRDGDGTLHLIPNSQIGTVSNLSRDFAVASLGIGVDASADPERVLGLLRGVAAAVHSQPQFNAIAIAQPTVTGVDQIAGRTLTYTIGVRVQVNKKDDLLRALRTRVVETFKAEGIPLGVDAVNLLVAGASNADPGPRANA